MPSESQLDFSYVEPESLTPNEWNTNVVDPENEEKIANSLDRHGFFKPVIVRETAQGTQEIIGGEHRWRIAKKRGELVPIINMGPIADERAREISLIDNGRYGEDDPVRLAALLEELNVDAMSEVLPLSDAEIDEIFTTASIASDIDLDDDDPTLEDEEPADEPDESSAPMPTTHQIMRFKVPVEDAERVEQFMARVMKEQNFVHADSLTNAGDALVHAITQMSDEDE